MCANTIYHKNRVLAKTMPQHATYDEYNPLSCVTQYDLGTRQPGTRTYILNRGTDVLHVVERGRIERTHASMSVILSTQTMTKIQGAFHYVTFN